MQTTSIIFREGWEEAAVNSLANEISIELPKFVKQYINFLSAEEPEFSEKISLVNYLQIENKSGYFIFRIEFDNFATSRLGILNREQRKIILNGIQKKLDLANLINVHTEDAPYERIYIASACEGCPEYLCYKTKK